MIGSVRARLTLAVVVAVGALAVAAALIAPRTVQHELVDDRLDAEIDRELDALRNEISIWMFPTGRGLGTPELTALFGPEIASLTDGLAESGTLERLRSFDPEGRLFVSPVSGVVGTVWPGGTVRVDEVEPALVPAPIVTARRLEELAVAFDASPGYGAPFDLFADDEMTFEEFIADLDARFGAEFGERLDGSVFGQIPGFEPDGGLIPRGVFEALQDELGAVADPPAPPSALPTADDYVFGVRRIDGTDVIVSASADGIQRSVDRVRTALWLAVPLAMLLTGVLTWLLAGRALRPVRAITTQTGRIRASTLHERVPVPRSNDEIAGLAVEMNTMLDRVHREDERRRQFVADASHELRSPIAAIRIQAEAAAASTESSEVAELATGVLGEAERMGGLVDDLLSLARHDEELIPPGTVLDLDDVVLTEAHRPRRVPVEVRGVSAGRVSGRAEELSRVVTHLLDNAARHAATRVTVSLDTIDGQVHLRVDDDGPGVPPEERERIFERFVRLDEARHRDGGGAGLGLAVVASVVRSNGGSVTVSASELGGAAFEVVFPALS